MSRGIWGDYEHINSAYEFSIAKLSEFVDGVSALKLDPSVNIVVTGSYGRLEASSSSDVDYFLLHNGTLAQYDIDELQRKVEIVAAKIGKLPSSGGPFGLSINRNDLLKNIGGKEDDNFNITRRVLFLTEGKSVGQSLIFDKLRDDLIARYIGEQITNHQLGMFFLNDIIRYYRTICVDFEYKVNNDGKEWGIRNIKLVFSRKLLYFGGLVVAAELAQRTAIQKRKIVKDLLSLTPIERICLVCGESIRPALKSYEIFVEKLADEQFRKYLNSIKADRNLHREENYEDFLCLKNESHHFTSHLMAALNTTYPPNHPIHRALIM